MLGGLLRDFVKCLTFLISFGAKDVGFRRCVVCYSSGSGGYVRCVHFTMDGFSSLAASMEALFL